MKKYNLPDWIYVVTPMDVALNHVTTTEKDIRGEKFETYDSFDKIDVKRALRDAERYMRRKPNIYPPEAIEDFKKLFPVAVEAAKSIGKFMKALAEKAEEKRWKRKIRTTLSQTTSRS